MAARCEATVPCRRCAPRKKEALTGTDNCSKAETSTLRSDIVMYLFLSMALDARRLLDNFAPRQLSTFPFSGCEKAITPLPCGEVR